jgi:trigger factor
MSIDDTKDIIYTYPEDHEDEALQGVEAVFHIIVTNVQKVTLPELDDEFAKSASDFDTLEALKTDIRETLQEQKQIEYDTEYNNRIIETLVEQSTIKYPPQMLESEKKDMLSNLEYQLAQQGINRELYLQIRKFTEEELLEEIAPLAAERLKSGLVLAEIAKVEQLQINQTQLAVETNRTIQAITQGTTPKETKNLYKDEYLYNLVNGIMSDMLIQQSVAYLRAVAKGDPLPNAGRDEPEIEAEQDTLESAAAPEADSASEAPAPAASEDDAPAEETADSPTAEDETPAET